MTAVGRVSVVIVVALAVPILPFALIGELPGERWLSHVDENAWLFALSGAGLLAADVLLPIPSSIVGSLLGARLGLVAGWLSALAGMTLASLIAYCVGHLWPRRLMAELPRAPTELALFLSRPVPVFSEAVAIAAGANRLPPGPFLVSTAAGNALYALALAANGAALLPAGFAGPGLVLPMALPALAWLCWRQLSGPREGDDPRRSGDS